MKKDFLSLDDIKRKEIIKVFKLTELLKKRPIKNYLKNKTFCLLFEKPSTRTRVSFETGIKQLGGNAIYLHTGTTQISRGETIEDTARVLDRYVHSIIARVYSHETLVKMSELTDAHVINALSDLEHPCQILSDLFTIKEKFKGFKGLKLAYVGDGNNVCNSLLLGCVKMGVNISIATPKRYAPNKGILKTARRYTKLTKSNVTLTQDPKKAVKKAHVVYNDTFISMGEEKGKRKKLRAFLPKYRVTDRLMKLAGPDVLYMHPLPAHRGKEVTPSVIDGPWSIVFDQAENRLHVQKALLALMMGRIWA